jgi:hypothetical protein
MSQIHLFKLTCSYLGRCGLFTALLSFCLFAFDDHGANALTFKSDGTVAQNSQSKAKSKSGKLAKSDGIMSFDVALSGSALENLKRLPFEFDFSKHEIWTDMPNMACLFKIERRPIEDRRLETMASGRLKIENGVFTFLQNSWRTRGMADPSHLQDEGNLRLLKDGTPVGKMPYFHLFINQGEVARPPRYVELTKEREQGEKGSPEGTFSFYVDDWQEGLFSLRFCKPFE